MRKRSAVQAEFGLRNFAIQIAGSCSWKRLERNGTKWVNSKGRRAYRVVEGSIRSSCACPLANWESVMRGGNTNLQSGQANDANKNTGINSQSSCPDVSQDRYLPTHSLGFGGNLFWVSVPDGLMMRVVARGVWTGYFLYMGGDLLVVHGFTVRCHRAHHPNST